MPNSSEDSRSPVRPSQTFSSAQGPAQPLPHPWGGNILGSSKTQNDVSLLYGRSTITHLPEVQNFLDSLPAKLDNYTAMVEGEIKTLEERLRHLTAQYNMLIAHRDLYKGNPSG